MKTETAKPMPLYQCHKQVRALKTSGFSGNATDGMIAKFIDQPEQPIGIPFDLYLKYKPSPGWYYVVYDDGYEAFSPPEAFEGGYTLVNENETFIDRLKAEHKELEERTVKLSEFINSDTFTTLNVYHRNLLDKQHLTMEKLEALLWTRIKDLELPKEDKSLSK